MNLYVILGLAFLGAASVATVEHYQVDAVRADYKAALKDRDAALDAAKNNFDTVGKLKSALGSCESQLHIFADSAKSAQDKQHAAYVDLDKRLADALRKSSTAQCQDWDKLPACGVNGT